ncbi:MAG: hypothetical protein IJ274_05495 [Lachnospiraceae bacterium]|nr:hypothetical protein [Lachnospiraceae bacterium]
MKKGYITVFFALVLMVLVSFVLTICEGIKINAYRLKAECAYSVAANSVLGEYRTELLEMYDLLYVDCAYKTGIPDYHQTEAHLWEYIENNMGISPASVEINQIVMATDNSGYGYRKQVSDYMKDRMGISYIEQLTALFQKVSKEGFLKDDLITYSEWDKNWQKALAERENIPEDTWKKIEKYSPIKEVYDVRESFVLQQVVKNENNISQKQVNCSDFVSNRELITGTGNTGELNLTDKIYFIGYVFEKFSYYSKKMGEPPLIYEIEYLIGENGSDYENLRVVAKKILTVRECINLSYLLSDNDKMALIKEISAALAAVVLCPELEPVFEILMVGLWSYAESVNDVKILFDGGKVPLNKSNGSWMTNLDSGFGLNIMTGEADLKQEGLGYKEYLQMLLLFQSNEKLTFRSMDLIEMNIREIKGNENFRMDGCAEDFLVNILFDFPQLGSYQMVRKFGYGL